MVGLWGRGVGVAALVVLASVLAGCSSDPAPPPAEAATAPSWPALGEPLADPLAPGSYTWTTADYDFGEAKVGGADASHDDYSYTVKVRGTLTMPDGPGPFPLAVFLHGQHTTCGNETGGETGPLEDCAAPYRNDRGYLYLMEHLASHGIATASILAHEINNKNGSPDIGMWARGELVLATVDALAASDKAPRLDLARIGLLGHSRGGEGVVTAVEVNAGRDHPYPLSAVVALAPTDFASRNVTGVPFLALAPYCDGDVYSLHALRQFDQSRFTDRSAVKVQLLVMGANHNNYNTMWGHGVGLVPFVGPGGDDAGFGRHQNTHCDLPRSEGGGRLSLEDTYAEATLHLAGFLRWTLLGDDGMAPYFLGTPQPPAACPDREASCAGAVHVSTMTPGRRDLFWAGRDGLSGAAGVKPTASSPKVCQETSCAENVYSSAWMADLPMELGAPAWVDLDLGGPTDLRETPVLEVRVGVPTDKGINSFGPPHMAVVVKDAKGEHRVEVDSADLFVPPALPVDPGAGAFGLAYAGGAKVAATAIRVALPAEVDAGNVTAFRFEFTAAGPSGEVPDRVLVADAWLDRATSAAVAPAGLADGTGLPAHTT
jgi:hypothetical protein